MDLFKLVAKLTLDSSEYEKGLGNAETKGSTFGSGLKKAAAVGAAAISAATTAVGAFAKKSIDAGLTFDASMSNVAAISGATGDDFDALRKKAQEMGASTKFTATEAADAMSYMAMAGWKTGDMLDGISGIMNLAAASGEDLATTSDIVTDALTAFGLKAEDSSHFADILAAASSNANTNVSLMGETFKYVAPIAGSLNISAEDMAESIGLVANAGIKGSQAGTSLRSIITRLSTDAGASSKKLGALGVLTKELGVQFYDSQGKVRDFSDILDEARVAWKNLGDEESTAFAKQIAGQYGMSAWLALMNSAPEDVDKLRSAIDTCSDSADGFNGTAERMAATMQGNLQGSITIFQSALEGVQIAISDTLTPSLKEFVDIGTKGLSGVANALREGDFNGAMEALGDALSKGIEKIISMAPKMLDAGMKLLEALGQGIMQNLPQLTQAATQIILMLAQFIIANLPQLVTAAVQIIVTLVQGIAQALPQLVPAAVDMILTIVDTLIENLPQIIDAALQLITALTEGLIDALPVLIERVPEIILAIVDTLVENFPKIVEAAFDLIVTLATALIDAAWQSIKTAVEVAIEGIKAALYAIGEFIVTTWETVTSAVETAMNTISTVVSTAWNAVGTFITTALTTISSTVTNIWSTILSTIGTKMDNIKTKITTVWTTIKTSITSAITLIKNTVTNGFTTMVSNLTTPLTNMKTAITGAFNSVKETVSGVIDSALTWGSDLIDNFVSGIKNNISKVGDAIGGVADKIKSLIGFSEPEDGPLSRFHTFAPDMMELFAQGIDQSAYLVTDALKRNFDFYDDIVKPLNMDGSASSGLTGSRSGDFNETINIYAPTALDPSEVARQTRKANREMMLALRGI